MCIAVQIADFGMARNLEKSDYYTSHGGQVPVKWTAPEVCHALLVGGGFFLTGQIKYKPTGSPLHEVLHSQ